jgi:CRP-like cAMP-binding protein
MNNKYYEVFSKSRLFNNINKETTLSLLDKLSGEYILFNKGKVMLRENSSTDRFFIILSGSAEATHLTIDGRRITAAHLSPSSIYGDVLAANTGTKSPVTVTCIENNTLVYAIKYEKIIELGDGSLFRNLTSLLSDKYFEMHRRIDILLCPDLRSKILSYLLSVDHSNGTKVFNIPFNREQLAEYLNANRSALSRELSKMKNEGILDYHGNSFKIK